MHTQSFFLCFSLLYAHKHACKALRLAAGVVINHQSERLWFPSAPASRAAGPERRLRLNGRACFLCPSRPEGLTVQPLGANSLQSADISYAEPQKHLLISKSTLTYSRSQMRRKHNSLRLNYCTKFSDAFQIFPACLKFQPRFSHPHVCNE